jgi:20S proteasome alpha/beta subunit
MVALIQFPIITDIWCVAISKCPIAWMYTYLLIVFSGMGPDFRVLVRKSRKQAQQYYRLYKVYSWQFIWFRHHFNNLPPVVMPYHYFLSKYVFSLLFISKFQMQETIPVTQLVRETAAVMQEFTQSGYCYYTRHFFLIILLVKLWNC